MIERERIRLPIKLWAAIVGVLLVVPTLVVIPLSFTDKRSFRFPIEGWSFQWYEKFFTDDRWMNALITSFALAIATAAVATTFGTLAAIALGRSKARGFSLIRGLVLLPIVIPAIVAAIAIYGAYLGWGINGTFVGILLAHVVLAIPFVIIAVNTAMRGLDPTMEKAAAVLGAGPTQRFLQIQLPLLAPGIATGFVFAFVTSLDEVVISYFLQSPTVRTLPVQMYSSVTVETDPSIAVASTFVLVLSTMAILVPRLVAISRERRLGKAIREQR